MVTAASVAGSASKRRRAGRAAPAEQRRAHEPSASPMSTGCMPWRTTRYMTRRGSAPSARWMPIPASAANRERHDPADPAGRNRQRQRREQCSSTIVRRRGASDWRRRCSSARNCPSADPRHGVHGLAHVGLHAGRIGARSNEDRGREGRHLQEWPIDLVAGLTVEPLLPDVAGDADDRQPRPPSSRTMTAPMGSLLPSAGGRATR